MLSNMYSGIILAKFFRTYSSTTHKIEPDPSWVFVAYSTSLIGGALFWALVLFGLYSILC